jgi:glycosyltransferase involved in cell wall biosynthesis
MRILFVNSFYYPRVIGGAERTLFSLVEGMAARGHDVRVIALGTRGELANAPSLAPPYLEYCPIRNIYFPLVDVSRSRIEKVIWHGFDIFNPLSFRDVQDAIHRFKPDVVSCHNLSGISCSAWAAVRKSGVPIVQVLHDYYLMCATANRSRGGKSCDVRCSMCVLSKLPQKYFSKHIDGVVGISRHILSLFLREGYFPQARLSRVIYNAASLDVGLALDQPTPETPTFGFIGAIARHKGIEVLLDAFQASNGSGRMKLLIAGTGEPQYVSGLRARYESADVQFLGQVEPGEFFPRLSFSVVPSLSDEPLGRVVFESLCFGIPVIGSRRGGIPEMVEIGVNGYLFDAGDAAELGRIIARAGEQQCNCSKNEIAATVSQFGDIQNFFLEYEQFYLDVTREQGIASKRR